MVGAPPYSGSHLSPLHTKWGPCLVSKRIAPVSPSYEMGSPTGDAPLSPWYEMGSPSKIFREGVAGWRGPGEGGPNLPGIVQPSGWGSYARGPVASRTRGALNRNPGRGPGRFLRPSMPTAPVKARSKPGQSGEVPTRLIPLWLSGLRR
jgi:hypothetical protein